MKQILIGDLHFGVYANSTTWLESQLNYLNKDIVQLIEHYKTELDSVIFLGDLFDVRYSLNIVVGNEIKKWVRKTSKQYPNIHFFFLGGNHDYYSPHEEQLQYNTYNLVFGPEFEKENPNVHCVTDKPKKIPSGLIMPWYAWENEEARIEYIDQFNGDTIYCHADLNETDGDTRRMLANKGITVMSGHIHYPATFENGSTSTLYNLGAALPLTFNDVNSDRYVYICEGPKIIHKYVNNTTMKFKRYYNENIFLVNEDSFKNCKTQLCISGKNINTAKYIEQIKYIKSNFGDYDIKIQLIDDVGEFEKTDTVITTNINKYIEQNIPEHLEDKYNKVKRIVDANKEGTNN